MSLRLSVALLIVMAAAPVRAQAPSMEWINPHAWMHVAVKKADGTVENWKTQGTGAPSEQKRGAGRNAAEEDSQ